MKTKYTYLIICSWIILFFSCKPEQKEAQSQYEKALKYFEAKEYEKAKRAIDSIPILYPNALDQQEAGILLGGKIKEIETRQYLSTLDSSLTVHKVEFQKSKESLFRFEKDSLMNEGFYIYNKIPQHSAVNRSQIRIQVSEKGQLQLLSDYYGATPIKHNSIRAILSDQTFAETLSIPFDGANNYQSSYLGVTIETVTYKDGQCSAIVALIANAQDPNITIKYQGGKSYNIKLNALTIEAIKESRNLANLMTNIDFLQQEYQLKMRELNLIEEKIKQLEAQS